MSAAVDFSYATWVARYPEFSAVPEATAASYFTEAGLYWRNDGTSLCRTTASQSLIMNILTAHIAALYSQGQGALVPGAPQPADTPVGRISSATQGSVTVATELATVPGTGGVEAWLAQTKYGLSFWSAIAAYRTMRVAPGSLQPGGLPPGEGPRGFGLLGLRSWCR